VLTDGDQIRNLLGAYCERIDAADYEAVGALFGTDGALAADDGTVLARGAEDIARFYDRLVRRHDGAQRTTHLVTNVVLDPAGEDDVTARSTYVVLQATDALPLQPIITGRYVDRFRRAPEGWAWVERRFAVDLVGHLAEHLHQR